MSQIDVRNAKLALDTRLRHWGLQGDTMNLAAGFIDDLIEQGWQIAAFRETRPQPPLVGFACLTCGGLYGPTCCDSPTQRPEPTTRNTENAQAARVMLHGTKEEGTDA